MFETRDLLGRHRPIRLHCAPQSEQLRCGVALLETYASSTSSVDRCVCASAPLRNSLRSVSLSPRRAGGKTGLTMQCTLIVAKVGISWRERSGQLGRPRLPASRVGILQWPSQIHGLGGRERSVCERQARARDWYRFIAVLILPAFCSCSRSGAAQGYRPGRDLTSERGSLRTLWSR